MTKQGQAALNMAESMGEKAVKKPVNIDKPKLETMFRGPIKAIKEQVLTIWYAFNDPATPMAKKALFIGSLIYLVSPFDIVPDVIPALGLLDDAAVIGFVFLQAKDIIHRALSVTVMNNIRPILDREIATRTRNFICIALIQFGIFLAAALTLFFVPPPVDLFIGSSIILGLFLCSIGRIIYLIVVNVPLIKNAAQFYRNTRNIRETVIRLALERHKAKIEEDFNKDRNMTAKIGGLLVNFFAKLWTQDKLPDFIPNLDELLAEIKRQYLRRVVLALLLCAAYVAAFTFLIRPAIITAVGDGLTYNEIIFFPIYWILGKLKGIA
jgi:uncharacterized membrane protein YkvA (DUF1232 family)